MIKKKKLAYAFVRLSLELIQLLEFSIELNSHPIHRYLKAQRFWVHHLLFFLIERNQKKEEKKIKCNRNPLV